MNIQYKYGNYSYPHCSIIIWAGDMLIRDDNFVFSLSDMLIGVLFGKYCTENNIQKLNSNKHPHYKKYEARIHGVYTDYLSFWDRVPTHELVRSTYNNIEE